MKITGVCCKLHDFIIGKASVTSVSEKSRVDNEFHSHPENLRVYPQDSCDAHIELHRRHRFLESSSLRSDLTI